MHSKTRERQKTREEAMGGGLTGQSLTDTATDDDIMQSDTGQGPSGLMGDVSLDWDLETFGLRGTGREQPTPDPYTATEAMHDMAGYAETSLPRADPSHDVAEIIRFGTIVLPVGSDPFLLAGADTTRRRVLIKNVSLPAAVNQCDINVGNDSSVPRIVGGSGGMLLRGGLSAVGMLGDSVELTTQGEIWVVQAVTPTVAPSDVIVAWALEIYAE